MHKLDLPFFLNKVKLENSHDISFQYQKKSDIHELVSFSAQDEDLNFKGEMLEHK